MVRFLVTDRTMLWSDPLTVGRRLSALERPLDVGDKRPFRAPLARHEEHVIAEQRGEPLGGVGVPPAGSGSVPAAVCWPLSIVNASYLG